MNMDFKRKLPIPMEIKEQYPVTPEIEAIKANKGQIMKTVMPALKGKADMKIANKVLSDIVR